MRWLLQCTIDENIIATTKIRNDYGAIQSFIFQISILDFSSLLLVKLSLLILFGISFWFFFDDSLSKVIALRTITIAIVVAIVGRAITKWGAVKK